MEIVRKLYMILTVDAIIFVVLSAIYICEKSERYQLLGFKRLEQIDRNNFIRVITMVYFGWLLLCNWHLYEEKIHKK